VYAWSGGALDRHGLPGTTLEFIPIKSLVATGVRRPRKLCRAQQSSITRSRTPSFHRRMRSLTMRQRLTLLLTCSIRSRRWLSAWFALCCSRVSSSPRGFLIGKRSRGYHGDTNLAASDHVVPRRRSSANHLIRQDEECRRDRYPKRLGGLEVEDELEIHRLLNVHRRPAACGVSKNVRERSQADGDSWNGLFDTQAGLAVGVSSLCR
jgi:hypothetical protein